MFLYSHSIELLRPATACWLADTELPADLFDGCARLSLLESERYLFIGKSRFVRGHDLLQNDSQILPRFSHFQRVKILDARRSKLERPIEPHMPICRDRLSRS